MSDLSEDILQYLRADPEAYFSLKEICKHAVHKSVYEENPHWAIAPLSSLVGSGQVEKNDSGHYRLRQTPAK